MGQKYMRRFVAGGLAALVASVISLERTYACGASVGGLPGVCDIGTQLSKQAKGYRAGVSVTTTRTALLFSGDAVVDRGRADHERTVALATFEGRPSPRLTVVGGGGALLGGNLVYGGRRFELGPGIVVASGISYALVVPKQTGVFVVGSAQFAALATETSTLPAALAVPGSLAAAAQQRASYTAFDLRVAVAAGYRISPVLSPYAVARAFGGPIFWRVDGAAVQGTDLYKYQLGFGAAIGLSKQVDVQLEASVVGEQALTAGVGLRM
jgi:hypothetical protein